MDNGFNQTNNIPIQPNPNAQPQQNYAQPQPNYVQPQQNYAQPQAGYAQPVMGTSENKSAYISNGTYVNQFTSPNPSSTAKSIGKEKAGMLFGLFSLLTGVIAFFLGIFSVVVGEVYLAYKGNVSNSIGTIVSVGSPNIAMNLTPPIVILAKRFMIPSIVLGFVCAFMAIGFAITAMILRGRVYAQTKEVTGKLKAGFVMAIIGIVTGGLGLLLFIIGFIFYAI